jgi:hypothetical protein
MTPLLEIIKTRPEDRKRRRCPIPGKSFPDTVFNPALDCSRTLAKNKDGYETTDPTVPFAVNMPIRYLFKNL